MFKTRKSEVMLLFITIIWGGTFPSIKVALGYASPLVLLGFRFAAAFLFLVLIARPDRRAFGPETLKKGVFLGILMFWGYGLQTVGLQYTDASRSGFLTYFYALLIPFFQLMILKKKPLPANIAGLLIAFGGLSLITGIGSGSALNRGDVITLCGAVSCSLYVVCLNLWTPGEDAIALTLLQMIVTALLGFGMSPFLEESFFRPAPLFWMNLLFLSLLGSVVAVYVMTRFQNEVSPTRAAILYSLEPVFSVVFAVLLLHEHFSFMQVMGSLLIISGVLISEILEIRREAVQQF